MYRIELDKACFQHNMAYGDFKDLTRITASDKVLSDKAFNIAKTPKYDMAYKFFVKKTSGGAIKSMSNQHKPNIKNFEKEKFILYLKTMFGVMIL